MPVARLARSKLLAEAFLRRLRQGIVAAAGKAAKAAGAAAGPETVLRDSRYPHVAVVSGHTGAGVHSLWRGLVQAAQAASAPALAGQVATSGGALGRESLLQGFTCVLGLFSLPVH